MLWVIFVKHYIFCIFLDLEYTPLKYVFSAERPFIPTRHKFCLQGSILFPDIQRLLGEQYSKAGCLGERRNGCLGEIINIIHISGMEIEHLLVPGQGSGYN